MKILYAIQGTGNGHITCARDLLPRLMRRAEVDILVSGCQVDVDLPYEIKYRFGGLSFIFGKKGGIDYVETYKRSKLKRLFREIRQLPVDDYDLVISDFEPVSAWACYIRNRPCVGLSHQAAVVNPHSPRPVKTDLIGRAVLRYYAPASFHYGYHYLPYDKNIFTPLIRREIREAGVTNKGHFTVYLPAYSDKRIIRLLSRFPQIKWQVFSKHCRKCYEDDHITIEPISNDPFIRSMASAEGVLCGAGFQTPAEVLFLRKKLMVVPMKGQYEQQCNAAALSMLGIPVIRNLKPKQAKTIQAWLRSEQQLDLDFPDIGEDIVGMLLKKHARGGVEKMPGKRVDSYSRFRKLVLKKIFYQPEIK